MTSSGWLDPVLIDTKPEVLDVPPKEAIEHFQRKGAHFGFDWRETSASLHASSFTVAKAMQADVLNDIRRAVDEAIAAGETFETFRDRLEPLLVKKGWWGQKRMIDPLTGKERVVRLGSARRLRTIFDTNIRTSYASGKWERIQRLKERMPFLRYVAVQDNRTRDRHRVWHGTVLPVDHSFWRTHFPPNGWMCRCTVQQMDRHDLERFGYEVSPDPKVRTRTWVNRRTGEKRKVPVGIDAGFDHNVGSVPPATKAQRILRAKVAAGNEEVARATVRNIVADPVFEEQFAEGNLREWLVGVIPRDLVPAKAGRDNWIGPVIDDIHPRKLRTKHPEIRLEDYREFQTAIEQGEVVLQERDKDLPTLLFHMTLSEEHRAEIRELLKKDKRWMRWVVKLHPETGPKLTTIYSVGRDEKGPIPNSVRLRSEEG